MDISFGRAFLIVEAVTHRVMILESVARWSFYFLFFPPLTINGLSFEQQMRLEESIGKGSS